MQQGLTTLAAAILMILNLLGVIAARRHRAFSSLQNERAQRICRQLNSCAERGGVSIEITSGFSNTLTGEALAIFAVALLASMIVWLYVIVAHAFL